MKTQREVEGGGLAATLKAAESGKAESSNTCRETSYCHKHPVINGKCSYCGCDVPRGYRQTEQDITDAIDLIESKIKETPGHNVGTWSVRGSALWKMQSAIRYLASLLEEHPEQYDPMNYTEVC